MIFTRFSGFCVFIIYFYFALLCLQLCWFFFYEPSQSMHVIQQIAVRVHNLRVQRNSLIMLKEFISYESERVKDIFLCSIETSRLSLVAKSATNFLLLWNSAIVLRHWYNSLHVFFFFSFVWFSFAIVFCHHLLLRSFLCWISSKLLLRCHL